MDEEKFNEYALKTLVDENHKSLKRSEYLFRDMDERQKALSIAMFSMIECLKENTKFKKDFSTKLQNIIDDTPEEYYEYRDLIQALKMAAN